MKLCFKNWIASLLSLLAMTGKVTMTKGLDCVVDCAPCTDGALNGWIAVVADAPRNDRKGRTDGALKDWIALCRFFWIIRL